MSVHLILITALLLWSCSESPDQPSADAGPPSLELGTGEREFEAFNEGDSIFIVQGPQDGYHFWGSMRALNINAGNPNDLSDPSNPTTRFEVYAGETRVDATASSYTQGLRSSEDGAEMIGRTVILDIEDDSELDGVAVRFIVTVEDVDGLVLSDERNLVGVPHPNNQ